MGFEMVLTQIPSLPGKFMIRPNPTQLNDVYDILNEEEEWQAAQVKELDRTMLGRNNSCQIPSILLDRLR